MPLRYPRERLEKTKYLSFAGISASVGSCKAVVCATGGDSASATQHDAAVSEKKNAHQGFRLDSAHPDCLDDRVDHP